MDQLPYAIFEHMFDYLEPRWALHAESFNREITHYVAFQRNHEKQKFLLKCVELWWRKTKYNQIMICINEIFLGSRFKDALCNTVVSRLWEERCIELHNRRIHDHTTGKLHPKWSWCDQCHFFPHSISDDGSRFDGFMTPWGWRLAIWRLWFQWSSCKPDLPLNHSFCMFWN